MEGHIEFNLNTDCALEGRIGTNSVVGQNVSLLSRLVDSLQVFFDKRHRHCW